MDEHVIPVVIKARDEASKTLGIINRSFTSLTGIVGGSAAVLAARTGMSAVIAGYRRWQLEQAKIKGGSIEILEAQLKYNESLRNTVSTIPIIGRSISAMMAAFGEDEGLKKTLALVQKLEAATERNKKLSADIAFENKIAGMKNADAPEYEIAAEQRKKNIEGKKAELDEQKKIYAESQKAYEEQIKAEDAAFKKNQERPLLIPYSLPTTYSIPLDRTRSDKLKKESEENFKTLQEYQQNYENMVSENEKTTAKEKADALTKESEAKNKASETVANKERDLAERRYEWNLSQQKKIEELQLNFIEDKSAREIAAINLKYKYEVEAARRAGMDTDLIKKQWQLERELYKPEEKKEEKDRGYQPLAAIESRFMKSVPGFKENYQLDMARAAKEAIKKIDKLIEAVKESHKNPLPSSLDNTLQLTNFG